MNYIALDTNTWIYLANGIEPVKLLRYLVNEVQQGNIALIVPDIVLDEWNRNKNFAVKENTLRRLKTISNEFDLLARLLGEQKNDGMIDFLIENKTAEQKGALQSIIKQFQKQRQEFEKAIQSNISLIDELFKNSKVRIVKTNDLTFVTAAKCALNKKAPMKEKNNFADALIMFSFLEYVRVNQIPNAFFISYNTKDFCENVNGALLVHKEIRPLFNDVGAVFFSTLGEALKTIKENIISISELKLIKQWQIERDEERDFGDFFSISMPDCIACYSKDNNSPELELYRGNLIDERLSTKPDPNQTRIRFGKEATARYSQSLVLGHCPVCNSEHYKCHRCGCWNLSDAAGQKFSCADCNLSYTIEQSFDEKGRIADNRYRILFSETTCHLCFQNYQEDGSYISTCPECIAKYSVFPQR